MSRKDTACQRPVLESRRITRFFCAVKPSPQDSLLWRPMDAFLAGIYDAVTFLRRFGRYRLGHLRHLHLFSGVT